MKKFLVIAGCVVMGIVVVSCSRVRRSPGRAYMPDMSYSRAYETYAALPDSLESREHVHYSALPVPGTIARGDMFPDTLKNDSVGYVLSANKRNPLDTTMIDKAESERLYLVNCAICHGAKLDGNGPLYKDGNGPYPSKPATLVGDTKYESMAEGTMFHSVTFGKNAMGSYASQLSTKQRWMVIWYIKSKQAAKNAGSNAAKSDTATTTKPTTMP